ncbi:MAG: hypothetical protein H7124_13275, partial [Phycisphaerales bacterium]|nr:hypothetical protein [Hyphomonadaceae bacterium]
GEGEPGEAEAREESEAEPQRAAPAPAEEERGERGARNGRRRRRGRGRGRRVYEVDGGEWLDFVGADLKHLTPRPERTRGIGGGRTSAAPVTQSPFVEETADIILHPAAEAAQEAQAAQEELAIVVTEDIGVVGEPAPASTREEPSTPSYEPDQERREKFFSRLSKWSKK